LRARGEWQYTRDVVRLDAEGYLYPIDRMDNVIISGGDMKKATAVLSGGSQTQITTQWTVQFELNGSGADAFGEATTKAVTLPPPQNQIAIVVDREVISAPRVDSPITHPSVSTETARMPSTWGRGTPAAPSAAPQAMKITNVTGRRSRARPPICAAQIPTATMASR